MISRGAELSPIDAWEEPAEQERAPERWAGHHIAVAALGVALALLALAFLGYAANAAYLHVPFSDAHNWMSDAFGAQKSGDWLSYLWAPHVDQRIPAALLVTVVDLATRERWPSFLIAGGGLWSIGCAGLATLLARARIALDLKLAIAALVATLALNIGLAEDFALPVFSVYLFVAGPALAAFALFPLSEANGLRSPFFWLSILLAALASCGNAAGLATWPALFAVAVMQRRSGAQIAAVAIAALACGIVIEAGLGAPTRSFGTGGSGMAHLWKMAVYFAAFGALPWSRAVPPAAAAAVGLVVWGAAASAFIRAQVVRSSGTRVLAAAGVGLILFGFITAVLATVGRVDEWPQPLVPTRYTPFASLLQIGVALAGLSQFQGLSIRKAAVMGPLVLAILIVATAPHGLQALARANAKITAASEAFDRTGQQGALQINPDPVLAASVRGELRRRGLPY